MAAPGVFQLMMIPALLLLLLRQAPAQVPQQAAAEPAEKCSIQGQVVKAGSGEPLKKASVMLRRMEGGELPRGAVTDAGGNFSFQAVRPGRYRLSVDRNGYLRQEYGQRAPGRPGAVLDLQPGQQVRDMVFRLAPWGVIAGRVLDEDGEPTPWVRVQTMRYSYERGHRQLVPGAGASANDLGEYRIYGLAPGRYYLSAQYYMAEATGGRGADPAPDESYVPVFYPGVTDPLQAVPVEVGPGSEVRGIDFALTRTRTVRIRGKVTSSVTGRPARGAVLILFPRDAVLRSMPIRSSGTVRDPQGAFELRGVAPGSYVLAAHLFEENKRYSALQRVEVGPTGLDGVQLVLAPGIELTGRVRAEGGADFKTGELYVSLQSGDPAPLAGGAARVKPDGSFRLNNIFPGTYTLSVSGSTGDFYLKSARLGGVDVLENGVTVGADTTGPLEVVFSPNGGRIEGSVVNQKDEAVGAATVVLVPESRGASALPDQHVATTDQYGRFALRGIAPGNYKLYAWEDVEPGAYQDPDFLKRFEGRGQSVRIQEGSRENPQLHVIPADPPGC